MKRTLAFILILATNTFSQSVILNSIVSDFQVSKASSDIYNDYPPKIQVLPDETFLISWIEEGSEGININAQIFSNDGSAKGEIFQVNDNSYLKPSKSFRVNSFADGKFAFA